MAHPLTGTKLALVIAGGELFAEYGMEGASTRAIAEKAGVNCAAINYHFGTKENLYAEALRYAVDRLMDVQSPVAVVSEPFPMPQEEELGMLIRRLVHGRFAAYLSSDKPRCPRRQVHCRSRRFCRQLGHQRT